VRILRVGDIHDAQAVLVVAQIGVLSDNRYSHDRVGSTAVPDLVRIPRVRDVKHAQTGSVVGNIGMIPDHRGCARCAPNVIVPDLMRMLGV